MMIRKIQYAPMKPGRQPCTMVRKDFMFYPDFYVSHSEEILIYLLFFKVRKDFMFSPGDMELEATLDQQLYHHGDTVSVNIRLLEFILRQGRHGRQDRQGVRSCLDFEK